MRAFLTIAIVALATAAWLRDPAAAGEVGKTNVTVIGVDGKAVQPKSMSQVPSGATYDENGKATDPGKGTVFVIHAKDDKGHDAYKVVFVPEGKTLDVTIVLAPENHPDDAYKQAKASQGVPDTYEKDYNAFKAAIDKLDQLASDAQVAIDQWADASGLPRQTLKQINKKLKTAEAVGEENQDKDAMALLRSYRDKLQYVETIQSQAGWHKKKLAELPVPPKKTTMLPGACPEGQSGGLLAGLINSATGTNSIQGICGEEPEKDHKDRHHDDHEDRGRD